MLQVVCVPINHHEGESHHISASSLGTEPEMHTVRPNFVLQTRGFSAWKMSVPEISCSLKPIRTESTNNCALLWTENQTLADTKVSVKTLLLFLGTRFSSTAFDLDVLRSCKSSICC